MNSFFRYNIINENGELFINNVKLEIGDRPTDFYPRLYEEESLLCQRYYFQNKYFVGFVETNDSKNFMINSYKYPVRMRITPTVRKLIDQPINNIHNLDWSFNHTPTDSTQITPKTPTILNDEMCCFLFDNKLISLNTLYMIRIYDNAYEFDAELY